MRKQALYNLFLLVPAPSLATWLALHGAPGTSLAQILFAFLKIYIFFFPLLVLHFLEGRKLRFPTWNSQGLGLGFVSGLVFAGILVGAYFLIPDTWIDHKQLSKAARGAGLSTPLIFVLAASYWCLVNSLLEEFLWRFFVAKQCLALWSRVVSIVATGLFFTLHHSIALVAYFDWGLVLLGSLGVFAASILWSLLYEKTKNIYSAWVSHIVADVAIFVIAYQIIFYRGL